MKNLFAPIRQAGTFILLLTLLVGILYPFIVTCLGKIFFQQKITGSLIYRDNVVIGSELIGQNFTADKYFWGRPSASKDFAYNAEYSAASNYGASNADYLQLVRHRIATLKKNHIDSNRLVPLDLVTASASGLDPHISISGAYYQVPRIAQARKISGEAIIKLIDNITIKSPIPLLGEARVNVLLLNLQLDKISMINGIKLNGQSKDKS